MYSSGLVSTPTHSAQFFTWMWQLCLSKIAKSKDPMFGLSPLAQLMYFESLIPNLSLVFARIASFCLKMQFFENKNQNFYFILFSSISISRIFCLKSFVIEKQKIQKNLSNWNCQNFQFFLSNSKIEKWISRHYEAFLVKINRRFRFSSQNCID